MDYLQQEDIKTTITNVDNDEELSSDTYEEEIFFRKGVSRNLVVRVTSVIVIHI